MTRLWSRRAKDLALGSCLLISALFLGCNDVFGALCAEIAVDNPAVDAAERINRCIVQGADKVIELLPGRYHLGSSLVIDGQSGIIFKTRDVQEADASCLSSDKGPACAILIANDTFLQGPLVKSNNAASLKFDHIVLDGNIDKRRAKLGSKAWSGNAGFNATIHDCTRCQFIGFASIRAVQGTGMEFSGDSAVFDRVLFRDNGWGVNKYPAGRAWADGLTVHSSRNLIIKNSEFSDNSDVNLIIGGAPNGRITNNLVRSRRNFSFAGIMLDNFNNGTSGDFHGAKIVNNTVDCGPDFFCAIGIDLGPQLWYNSSPIQGGEISNNTIIGARQGIGIYGVEGAIVLQNNIRSSGGFQLPDGRCRTSKMDVFSASSATFDDRYPVSRNSLKGCSPELLAATSINICDQDLQPSPGWGIKRGQCLKSCGELGGPDARAFADSCTVHGMVSAGIAYDVENCCIPAGR